VEGHYARLFEEAPSLAGPGGNLVFTGTDDDPGTLETLATLGFRDVSAAAGIVRRWHHGRYRATATARVDQSVTVQFGMRANEQAIRSQLQTLAVFAAVTTSATNPNAALQVQALSQRVAQNLAPQPGQQTIEDIQSDLSTAQVTMKDAQSRQTQAQGTLQGIVDQAESVSPDQVASQILALQTSLQASYQTTAMLSQLTLTKYLPLA